MFKDKVKILKAAREKQSVERCMLELGKGGLGRDPANRLGSH